MSNKEVFFVLKSNQSFKKLYHIVFRGKFFELYQAISQKQLVKIKTCFGQFCRRDTDITFHIQKLF